MGRLPIDRSVLDSALERMDIADIAQATIRQSGDIARIMETQTGMEFLHLEMGVPGLPPEKAGVEAECRALQSGVASQYPNMFGIPELKQQTSRFIRAFLDVGVAPQGCIPTVGSMQGSFTAFLLCSQLAPGKDTILFIDPGFPVQRNQVQILDIPSASFDIYEYRAEKLGPKLESYLAQGNIAAIVYSNPNNPAWICLTEDELQQVSDQTDSFWGSISTAMTEYGVAKSSFNLAYADYYTKFTKVFDATYGPGGTEEVSDEDVKDYYLTNYKAFSYVMAPIIDMTTGASLSDDELSQLDTEFKGYASQINDGSMTIQDAADAYKTSSGDDTVQVYTDAADFSGETASYPLEFGTELDTLENGKASVIDVQGLYKVLLVKDDINATADERISDETSRTSILQTMKQEEFQAKIDDAADSYNATVNQSAIDSYQPDMFVQETSSVAASTDETSSQEGTDGSGEETSSEAA